MLASNIPKEETQRAHLPPTGIEAAAKAWRVVKEPRSATRI
jgi:hypothetical protein